MALLQGEKKHSNKFFLIKHNFLKRTELGKVFFQSVNNICTYNLKFNFFPKCKANSVKTPPNAAKNLLFGHEQTVQTVKP